MPAPNSRGKLDDPDWRRDRARKGGRSRTTLDHYVAKIVEQAPALTTEQIDRLRQLLPPVAAPAPARRASKSKGGDADVSAAS